MAKKPVIIGLTGSIGMGKSFVTRQFEDEGATTCNADEFVHQLLAKGGRAVREVATLFPEAYEDDAINRKKLGEIVFTYPAKLKALEEIIHPFVIRMEKEFVENAAATGSPLVVLDIPLLFEKKGDQRCHYTVVVSAPKRVQRKRVLARPNMTEEKFESILKAQMPDEEKRERADFVVYTGLGKHYSLWQVRRIIKKVQA